MTKTKNPIDTLDGVTLSGLGGYQVTPLGPDVQDLPWAKTKLFAQRLWNGDLPFFSEGSFHMNICKILPLECQGLAIKQPSTRGLNSSMAPVYL